MHLTQTYDIKTKEMYWTFVDTNHQIWHFKSHQVQSFVDVRHRILR